MAPPFRAAVAGALCGLVMAGSAQSPPVRVPDSPYQIVERWPSLSSDDRGAGAIGLVPDEQGGGWALLRSRFPFVHFNASGRQTLQAGEGLFAQPHGLCRDREGNFWAADSGPFADASAVGGRGYQVFKFSPDGSLLLTLGKAGLSSAGPDMFVGPSACAVAENGDVIIADGHWPRASSAHQDGDRLVRYTSQGQFVREYGSFGRGPGEFMGPHGLAFDAQGRLFVADRSNNRVQIFDREMRFVASWTQFGRPSAIAIGQDGTVIVGDSESGMRVAGPEQSPEGGGVRVRNASGTPGIRTGRAADGSLLTFIGGTRPEAIAVDAQGVIFAGLTSGCAVSGSGGCVQKWVRR